MQSIINNLDHDIKEKLKGCRLILLDFDGVLTDNLVVHYDNGTEAVMRSKADSMAIDMLYDAGLYDKPNYENLDHELDIVILSREPNSVVASVGKKISIKSTQSLNDKLGAFREELEKRKLTPEQVLFMGNDYNDIDCIKTAGIGVAVADAYEPLKQVADYITQAKGGHGAFREICELILLAKNKHQYNKR